MTLVLKPLNSAVVQGSAVTLQCSSDVNNSVVLWYNSLCVTSRSFFECRNDAIYNGFSVLETFQARFQVTAVNNGTHVTRDFNINSTQLTDAGVYLCAEQRRSVADLPSASAQLIVLGNILAVLWKLHFKCNLLQLHVQFRSIKLLLNLLSQKGPFINVVH